MVLCGRQWCAPGPVPTVNGSQCSGEEGMSDPEGFKTVELEQAR